MAGSTRAISWAAVSSKPQANRESLQDQHRLNHALADALGWEIICDITVPGESRSYFRLSQAQAHIGAYKELLDLVESNTVEWLICKGRDRLGRTRRLNREVADFLQDQGVRVYSRTMPPGSLEKRTEAEVWGEAIESGYSEAEIIRLKQRRLMGMRARVRKGKLPARPPWGFSYVSVPGRREPRVEFTDPLAEATVRFVIGSYLKGWAKNQIVLRAERDELRTPGGGDWSLTVVNGILYQPAYYSLVAFGRRRYVVENGKRKHKKMPPSEWVIAEAEFDGPFTPAHWDQLWAEHKRRAEEHPRRRSTPFPLSGIAWCEICDLPFSGTTVGGLRYYRCQTSWAQRTGPQHLIRDHVLHRELGKWLRRLASDPEWLTEALGSAREMGERDLAAQRDVLQAQHQELARRRSRWGDAYEQGVIDLAELADRLKALEAEEARIEEKIVQLDDRAGQQRERERLIKEWRTAAEWLPDILAGELSIEQRQELRMLFRRVFRRVSVRNKEITGIELAWA